MESDFVLPCNNSPLSVSIPQSYGKGGDDYSNCSISCIFWGVSTIGASVLNVEVCLLLLLFGNCLLHTCRHKNIYNLGVEIKFFQQESFRISKMQAASKGKEFSTFYVWEDARVISLKLFLLIHTSSSGASILSFPSLVSSGTPVGSGCSLMAARE